jgi:hypothetical protein
VPARAPNPYISSPSASAFLGVSVSLLSWQSPPWGRGGGPPNFPHLRGTPHPWRSSPGWIRKRSSSLWSRPRPPAGARRRSGLQGPAPFQVPRPSLPGHVREGCPGTPAATARALGSAAGACAVPKLRSCSAPPAAAPAERGPRGRSDSGLQSSEAHGLARARPRSSPPARPMAGGGVTCAARGTPGPAGSPPAPGQAREPCARAMCGVPGGRGVWSWRVPAGLAGIVTRSGMKHGTLVFKLSSHVTMRADFWRKS